MDENKTTSATTAPAPKKVRRVGRIAFAVLLILAGILLLVQQFVPHFDLLSIVRFAPALLILLGIEVLVYSANPQIQLKFDWLSVLGCGFILVVVGCSSLVPVAWSLYSPQRDYAESRYQTMLQDQFYQSLSADTDLKAKIRNLQIYVDFNHTESGEYTLQDGDTIRVYVELPENGYADAVSFAADCRRITELSEAGGINADDYSFTSSSGDSGTGSSYSLDFLASFAQGLTDEQLAQRVNAYYEYEGDSYDSKAARDNAAKAVLREQVIQEFADGHDGQYPGDEYISEEVEKRFNELFPTAPEAPAAPDAPAAPAAPATPESAA